MTIRLRAALVAGLISIFAGAPRLAAQTTPSTTLYFTHWVAGFGFVTDWSVVNTSGVANACTLHIISDDGSPVATTAGTGPLVPFSMLPNGTFEAQTTSTGALVQGYSRIDCLFSATGGEHYSYNLAGQPNTEVGAPNSYPADTFISEANSSTGFAMVNIGSLPVGLSVTASNLDGSIANAATMTLGAGQHIARNGFEFFSAFPSNFKGQFKFRATSPTVLFLSLGVDNTTANPAGFNLFTNGGISFDSLPSSLSGTFSVIAGANVGSTGNISISNIAPFDTGTLDAMVSGAVTGTTIPVVIDTNQFHAPLGALTVLARPSSQCPGGDLSASLTFNPSLASYSGIGTLGCGSAARIVQINSLK